MSFTPEEIILKQTDDVMPISSFAESVEYLELKLDKVGISLGEVEAIKQINDDWIIKHRISGVSSFIRFNRHGEFVTELAGKKQKEIINPEDILAFDDGFAVLAENGIHLVAKDGKYIRKLIAWKQEVGSNFFFVDKHFMILNEKLQSRIVVEADNNDQSLRVDKKLPQRVQRMMYTNAQAFRKNTSYYSVLSDSIFRMADDGRVQSVTRLAGEGIPTFSEVVDTMINLNEMDALKYLRETNHVMIKKYLENNEFLFLTYWEGSNSSTLVINKGSGEMYYFGHGVNDIDGGIWERPLFLTGKNELVIPLTAYKISGHKISNKKVKGFDRLQTRIATSGNPVLMLCKLK